MMNIAVRRLMFCLVCALAISIYVHADDEPVEIRSDASVRWKEPTVLIVTLFRNKGHVLPYFFSYLERLDYPKERISLW